MEMYLPAHCYSGRVLKPEAIVIHYFSVINVQADNPFDLQSNWMLMNDLNLPKKDRIQFLKRLNDPEDRMYASAHCFIDRDGKLALLIPENLQAYHAGRSEYAGRNNWNAFSYGIELIGTHSSGFTDEQYEACAKHCRSLMLEYDIRLNMIVGHEDIAPGRKFDPGIATGNFDMKRLKDLILIN